ncbi:MAG: DUF1987 domain-containing protein [Bacteroidota bacterium]
MESLVIEKTVQTPEILLKPGLIKIGGRSIPEDPIAFYQPVIDWLKEYTRDLPDKTEIHLEFEYINTSSSKSLHNILKILNDACDESHEMEIKWHYEEGDDDMYELGQFYKPYLTIPIKFIETEE